MDNKENNSNSEKLPRDIKTKEEPGKIRLENLERRGAQVGMIHKCVVKK